MNSLINYRALVAKVDAFCRNVETGFAEHIVCGAGCDSCCRHLTLFPVEACALAQAVNSLPAEDAGAIRQHVDSAAPDRCPLLKDGLCLLYEHRPLICRTHGLPLIVKEENGTRVDCCPRNFTGLASLPGGAVLNLDTVNAALVAINAVFVTASGKSDTAERVSVAEAILGKVHVK